MTHAIEMPTDVTVPPTSRWKQLPLYAGVVGAIGLIATLGMAVNPATRDRAMFSYLFAFEVFLGLALGSLGFILIDLVVRSSWSIAIRRIAETFTGVLPIFVILFIPIATIGFHSLYPWTHEVDEVLLKKRWFLTPGFWVFRAFLYLAAWVLLSQFVYRNSVRQDGLDHDIAKRDAISRKLRMWAAPGIILWAVTLSFAAIDWIMSLSPHWYSTIYGVYYFAGAILVFFAGTTLVALGLQRGEMLKRVITVEHYHDLGKYTFGFTVFWAYIAFSQFMLIWYANIPEEIIYYLTRVRGGWAGLTYFLPIGHFFLPFLFLVSRKVKRRKALLATGAVWTVAMYLLDMYWLIMPNYGAHGGQSHISVSWLDFAALCGVGGAFFAAFGYLLNKNKIVAIGDPRLQESLAHENY